MILLIAEVVVVGMWFVSVVLTGVSLVVSRFGEQEDDPLTPPDYLDPYHDFGLVA